jgi:hypothetical protein
MQWETIWQSLKKLLYDSVMPLIGIYLKKCAPGYTRATFTLIIITALFKIARLCKYPRCPTTDEWMNKMWCEYTIEFYSVIKENEIMLLVGQRIELEKIMISKVSQVQKVKGHMFCIICGSKTYKLTVCINT